MNKEKMIITGAIVFAFINVMILTGLADNEKDQLVAEQHRLSEGFELINQEQFSEGASILEEFMETPYADASVFHLYLARAYFTMEEYEQSHNHYQLAYNIDPNRLRNEGFLEELELVKEQLNG